MTRPRPDFFEIRHFPWAQDLEKQTEAMRAEAAAVPREAFAPWPRDEEGSWLLLPFFTPTRRFEENCALCPGIVRWVDAVPLVQMATLSLLLPGGRISSHQGFSPTVLRAHLPLVVPDAPAEVSGIKVGAALRGWEAGRLVVFDDHLPHESFNDTGQPRLNLMFDFLRPWRFRTSGLGFLRQRLAPEASYARSFDRVAGDR